MQRRLEVKVIMLCKTKVLPGKMAEYMELEKKMFGVTESAEAMPPYKRLMLMSGAGDMQHVITYLFEFDSFAAMDKWAALAGAPEFQALMPKWDSIIESHEHDVYMESPLP
jgi:antibiotic biosynthesis monooxygenase (ABM) superfamily enzyme